MKNMTTTRARNKHNSLTGQTSRRAFLQRTALFVGGAALGTQYLGAPRLLAAASLKPLLRVAVIGVGGMGGYSFEQGMREQLVAVCDVDDNNIAKAMKQFGGAAEGQARAEGVLRLPQDVRRVPPGDRRGADRHARPPPRPGRHPGDPARQGRLLQKPLAHDIDECYALAKAAREKKVLTQMGNQGHCSETIRRVCEYIWAGAIGKVTETHSILGRNFGGSGGRPRRSQCPRACTGTSGSARRPIASITTASIPLAGGTGGVRHGHDRRHGLPQPGRAVLGAQDWRGQDVYGRVPAHEDGSDEMYPKKQHRPL